MGNRIRDFSRHHSIFSKKKSTVAKIKKKKKSMYFTAYIVNLNRFTIIKMHFAEYFYCIFLNKKKPFLELLTVVDCILLLNV